MLILLLTIILYNLGEGGFRFVSKTLWQWVAFGCDWPFQFSFTTQAPINSLHTTSPTLPQISPSSLLTTLTTPPLLSAEVRLAAHVDKGFGGNKLTLRCIRYGDQLFRLGVVVSIVGSNPDSCWRDGEQSVRAIQILFQKKINVPKLSYNIVIRGQTARRAWRRYH